MNKSQSKIQWIVKDKKEKISGPHSTQRILEGIRKGEFGGGEQVARYPGGKWLPMVENATFYNELLASLQEVIDIPMPIGPKGGEGLRKGRKRAHRPRVRRLGLGWGRRSLPLPRSRASSQKEKSSSIQKGRKGASSTSLLKPHSQGQEQESLGEPFESLYQKGQAPLSSSLSGKGNNWSGSSNSDASANAGGRSQIELRTQAKSKAFRVSRASKQRRGFLLMLSLIFIGGGCVLFFGFPHFLRKNKMIVFTCCKFRKGQKPIGKEEEKKKFLQALQLFQRDEMESYFRAQDILVELVERNSKNLEASGLLCTTYRLLWPLSYQDHKDLKVIGFVAQLAKSVNPIDVNSVLCDITHLMLRGRWKKVHSLLYQALNNYQDSAILYHLKGGGLMEEKKNKTALIYIEQSLQIWPKWIHTHLQRAQILQFLGKNTEALEIYRAVLKKRPDHPKAKILLGIMYAEVFKDKQKALSFLLDPLQSKQLLPPLLKASAMSFVAESYRDSKQFAEAIKWAKKSFQLNPRNEKVKDILTQLGSDEEALLSLSEQGDKNRGSVFVSVADQFMRSGNYIDAYAELSAALDKHPKDYRISFRLAQCLWKLNRPKDSLSYLNQTLRHNPKFVDAFILQADYLSQQFQYQAAHRALKSAQKIERKNHLVYYGYALVSFRQNDLNATLQFAQLALKIYSVHTKSLVLMGKAFLKRDSFRKLYIKPVKPLSWTLRWKMLNPFTLKF